MVNKNYNRIVCALFLDLQVQMELTVRIKLRNFKFTVPYYDIILIWLLEYNNYIETCYKSILLTFSLLLT